MSIQKPHRDVYSSFIRNCLIGSNQDTLPASLVAQTIKDLPVIQGTQVQSLGQEDPLEKGMATHSSILTWRIPWTEESGELQSVELQRVGHNWVTNTHTNTYIYIYWRVIALQYCAGLCRTSP